MGACHLEPWTGGGTKEQGRKKARQYGEVWLTPVEVINDPLLLSPCPPRYSSSCSLQMTWENVSQEFRKTTDKGSELWPLRL